MDIGLEMIWPNVSWNKCQDYIGAQPVINYFMKRLSYRDISASNCRYKKNTALMLQVPPKLSHKSKILAWFCIAMQCRLTVSISANMAPTKHEIFQQSKSSI